MISNHAPKLESVTQDPLTAVRALNRMRTAGFVLSLEDGRLMVEPLSQLSEAQRTFIRTHKAALVELLIDAELLASAIERAGPSGLGWKEGTPDDWSDARLLAAGEALYSTGRMVSALGRRYTPACAPPLPEFIPFVWTPENPAQTEVAA